MIWTEYAVELFGGDAIAWARLSFLGMLLTMLLLMPLKLVMLLIDLCKMLVLIVLLR